MSSGANGGGSHQDHLQELELRRRRLQRSSKSLGASHSGPNTRGSFIFNAIEYQFH